MTGKIFFETADLCLAATLSLFYPILFVNKSNPRRAIFEFRKDKKFDLFLQRYWDGKLRVDPQKFFQNLKLLKGRIYSN